MERNYFERQQDQWNHGRFICLGLNPETRKMPEDFVRGSNHSEDILKFNMRVIDRTHDLVFGYAINSGCYDRYGSSGWKALESTFEHIRNVAPHLPIIFEGNTGNVPETAEMYAEAAFDRLGADAVVVNPYMGRPTPYLNRKNKGIFILCRTSNPRAGEVQDLSTGKDTLLHESVAKMVKARWNEAGNCGLVVGSPFPMDIASVRKLAPEMPILTPGIGVQGGDLRKTIEAGISKDGTGVILWMSRTILYGGLFEDGSGPRRALKANNHELEEILTSVNEKVR